MRWLLLVGAVSCASSPDAQPAAVIAEGTPRFDTCGDRELPTFGGGCVVVGGEVKLVAAPVESCPDDPYGAPPSGTTVYVDASFTGTASGTRDAPYRTIGEAITAGTGSPIIAIAAGTYVEDVYTGGAKLWGRCASKVTIRGVSALSAAIELGGDSTVHGVTVSGPGWGIVVDDGVAATIEWTAVRETGRVGIEIDAEKSATRATVRDCWIEKTVDEGIYVDGGEVTVERSAIRDIKPYKGKSGIGIRVELGTVNKKAARGVVRGSLIERATEAGVAANGSIVMIEDSVVRDTNVRADGSLGVGVYADRSELEVHRSLITNNHRANVYAVSSQVKLSASVLAEGLPRPDDKSFGLGIEARLGVDLTVDRCLVTKNRNTGIMVRGAKAVITDSIVADTLGNASNGEEGFGIAAWLDRPSATPATLEVRRTVVLRNHAAGVAIGGSSASIEDSVVRDTEAASDGFGDGIIVGSALSLDGTAVDASASLTRVLIEKNARSGAVVAAASLTIRDASLRCNALDLEVSSRIGARGWAFDVEKAFTLNDGGGVVCGCSTIARCSARTTELRTVAAPSDAL